MIEEGDRDGDGEVNEDDFLRIMKKTGLYQTSVGHFIFNVFENFEYFKLSFLEALETSLKI